ncbi:UDP-glycosyltransferase 73C1-like [Tripterygium wilfordii]|uniref:Glycosyltransferase n=1 Tax=Tripterygium wilfordii TaxID=458696 RepID=A0A7J7DWB5_TRIWF|nr:UDP-glycosyltransferase 73C3-like [Tripterygium wilfordii]KAF5750444.1 UDP-glycosyltransferase 73C1-like [Tripterygium wilfordii]
MTSIPNQLHFALFPFMAQGHITPMIDIAKLFAEHNVMITIITTPVNAARFKPILDRAMESGLPIQLLLLQFPCAAAGLPDGCESMDMLPSLDLGSKFFDGTNLLLEQAEKLFEGLEPKPSCIISDQCLPYTIHIAKKYSVPRISFDGCCCFSELCLHNLHVSNVLESISSEDEYFVVPGLSDRIEITKAHLPKYNIFSKSEKYVNEILMAEERSYGFIINTFEELEQEYVNVYKEARENKVWCVGPVSLSNKNKLDKVQRGNKTSIEEYECTKWLESWQPGSVLYVCLGSLCNLIPSHLIELALGLEESGKPFIWAIRGGDKTKDLENWVLENGYEERIKGRGLLIRGWAPQILILSHPAIGGFLTHCGWNSTLEGICAGVPMITWPLFADQFLNEKLIVQILRIGVRVGADVPLRWGEEEAIGLFVKKEDVKNAIEKLMGQGEEEEGKRQRARELGEMSKRASEEGGSSQLNIALLIEEIRQRTCHEEPI